MCTKYWLTACSSLPRKKGGKATDRPVMTIAVDWDVKQQNKQANMFFHALTFAVSRGSCLNTSPLGRVFKNLPRDPASINA